MRRLMEDLLTVIALALLVATILNGLIMYARGAPAPAPKRPRPDPLAGAWVLRWGGVPYDVVLRPGGGYECRSAGGLSVWSGTWRLDGDRIHFVEVLVMEGHAEVPEDRRRPFRYQLPLTGAERNYRLERRGTE